MKKKPGIYQAIHSVFILLFLLTTLFTTSTAIAASVTLAWDAVDGSIDGYRVFARKSGASYNYSQPAWKGTATTCTINNLEDQTDYYFVVRAFDDSVTSSNSNEVYYSGDSSDSDDSSDSADSGDLASRFAETTLTSGVEYYTDRSYQLTGVPSFYNNMEAIITPNDDQDRTDASGYLTFTMPYDGTVYVAYDSRAVSLPNWMNGFIDTGDIITTSLSTQPSLKIYSREYDKGDVVNLGGNKAAGFVGGTISNYIVFYSDTSGQTTTGSSSSSDSSLEQDSVAVGVYLYTDRNYRITSGVPDWMSGRTLIQTPNDERSNSSASGYVRFTNTVDWWVYVLFDSRCATVPNWLSGWELRSSYRIRTSLATQPYLKVYRKMFDAGEVVNLGGNYGPGSSSENRSNYVVVYGK